MLVVYNCSPNFPHCLFDDRVVFMETCISIYFRLTSPLAAHEKENELRYLDKRRVEMKSEIRKDMNYT